MSSVAYYVMIRRRRWGIQGRFLQRLRPQLRWKPFSKSKLDPHQTWTRRSEGGCFAVHSSKSNTYVFIKIVQRQFITSKMNFTNNRLTSSRIFKLRAYFEKLIGRWSGCSGWSGWSGWIGQIWQIEQTGQIRQSGAIGCVLTLWVVFW